MRHLTKRSTSTFFFSEVMKRSGSVVSRVRIRLVEIAHVLDERDLHVQTGLTDLLLDLTQLENQRMLTLIHGKQGHRQDGNDKQADPDK
jgi:hypothetical protein